MNKLIISLAAVIFMAGCGQAGGLTLKSSTFKDGNNIPKDYTCKGEGISPPLQITNIPEGTVKFALIMHDTDTEKDFVHWTMWNFLPDTTNIPAGSVPEQANVGNNDFGELGYKGPCPPEGERHTYTFDLYALDSTPAAIEGASREDLLEVIQAHIIEQATLTGTFKR